ncbi:glycoside hydrolase domain-containing protein [Rothia sp. 32237D007AR]
MDLMVLNTQQWLNSTYGKRAGFGTVKENGQTGWDTIYGLIRALQLELGITSPVNNFGPGTQSRFQSRWPNGLAPSSNDSNVHGIIQGALWCKGYPAEYGGITPKFSSNVAASIIQLKKDIGLDASDAVIDLELMMALLSMKQFRLLTLYGGNASIRSAQQAINRQYKNYTGIVPTDGLYGREMNTALIQVLQSLEGFTPEQATGFFGSGTRSRLQTVNSGTSQWVWLATVALVCNGYDISVSSTWNQTLANTVRSFQSAHALPVSGSVDPTTWMSLLTSKGDPDRPAVACDTRFEITDEFAGHLKSDGYKIVGRYLTEPGQESLDESDYFKALRTGELERIVKHGLKYFPIFQEYSTKLSNFTVENGIRHAREAQVAAQRLGVPPTVIYFAVDYDATDPEVTSNILPYFQAVSENLGGGYKVGIYAARNVCSRTIGAGFASAAFVSDMSTGFSGNLGFPIPERWVFDQFHEISGYKGKWDLDRVAYSGLIEPCSTVEAVIIEPVSGRSDPLYSWVRKTEEECIAALSGLFSPFQPYKRLVGQFILEWLRKPEYWDGAEGTSVSLDSSLLWKAYTPELTIPAELHAARLACASVCEKQPKIKRTIAHRDIAHWAATTLGYLHWGVETQHDKSGLGDLGGWPLDLLQIWGAYKRDTASPDSLEVWLTKHLGKIGDSFGFDYADVLADGDAWLVARYTKVHPGEHSLSEAIQEVYSRNESERIRFFYQERFGSSSENVVKAYAPMTDGIDAFGIENVVFTNWALKQAANTDSLPTADEAKVSARCFAKYLESPNPN